MSYPKKELPIGKKFNKLTIISEVPTNEKCRRYVYCECECGSKKTIRFDSLQSGRIKSCGCLLSCKNQSQIEKMVITRRRNKEKVIADKYIGKRFNSLTVRSIYPHPNRAHFNVECDCGKCFPVSLSKLKTGHTRSCGCIRRKHAVAFISEIDNETLQICNCRNGKYQRIVGADHNRPQLHAYEAKKLYSLRNLEWEPEFTVHHIDSNGRNNRLTNLAVIPDNATHHRHHKKMEIRMYEFLLKQGLIEKFYEENPELRLKTLADTLCA